MSSSRTMDVHNNVCDLSLSNPPKLHYALAVHGWSHPPPPPFAEADSDGAPSTHSSSSAVITVGEACSGQSDCSLKEHDYIGMAEVSSVPSAHEAAVKEEELNLAETDLRLGLGPVVEIDEALDLNKNEDGASELKKNERKEVPQPRAMASTTGSAHGSDAVFCPLDEATTPLSTPSTWHNSPLKSADVKHSYQANGFPFPPTNVGLIATKNGCKRMYADTIVDAARESRTAFTKNSTMSNAIGTGDTRVCANMPSGQALSAKHFQDDIKAHKMYPQNLQWSIPKGPPLQSQSDCRGNAFHAMPIQTMNFTSVSADMDGDFSFKHGSSSHQKNGSLENGPDDAPPAKGQVVGWPPIPSYRRSSVAARSKVPGENAHSQSAYYVKVNMDGIHIGRKIDLIAYRSYEALLAALEDMFHGPNSGHSAPILNGSDYVLTYEDKEGDWMLVGDVPWGMFVSTVRRLRISRGSDISGGGS